MSGAQCQSTQFAAADRITGCRQSNRWTLTNAFSLMAPSNRWKRLGCLIGCSGAAEGRVRYPKTTLGRYDRERLPAAHRRGGGEARPISVHFPSAEALQYLIERDTPFDPRQCVAEADMMAITEGEVRAPLAVNVEPVRIGQPAPVT